MLAAVHGPRATAQRKEDPERAVIEVVCRPRTGLAGVRLLMVLGAVITLSRASRLMPGKGDTACSALDKVLRAPASLERLLGPADRLA